MRVIALFALCFAAVTAVPMNPQRIVGGNLTTIDKYPTMAALLYSRNAYGHRQACGGSIVTKNAVLTAAHCTYGDAIITWRVRVGSNYANSGGHFVPLGRHLLSAGLIELTVPTNPQRIVGGNLTTIDKYPTMAALLYSRNAYGHRQACGGSIVTKNAVLTAAHCTYGDAIITWRVRVGSNYANSGGTVFNTEAIINHPQYNSRIYNNDIALLRVSGTFSFNNNVQPASIAGPNYNLADNQVVWATGWGTIAPGGLPSEQLRHVQIWTINQQICARRYATSQLFVTDNMLCSGWLDVGGRDQCQGDSGGPLFHNGVVVGICSWGQSCALAEFPGVNTRVSRYTSWLQNNV